MDAIKRENITPEIRSATMQNKIYGEKANNMVL